MAAQKKHILHHDYFHVSYTVLSIFNAFLVTLKITPYIDPKHYTFIDKGILAFSVLMGVELLWRLAHEKKKFVHDLRNVMSLTVLLIVLITGYLELTILLILSSFKVFRKLKKVEHLTDTLIHILPGVINLLLLIFMIYFVFAVLATYFLGEKVPERWGNLLQSSITLQQLSLADDWGEIFTSTLEHYPYAWFFLQAFLIIMAYVLLNLFVGILMDGLQAAQQALSAKEADDTDRILQEIRLLQHKITALEQRKNEGRTPRLPSSRKTSPAK